MRFGFIQTMTFLCLLQFTLPFDARAKVDWYGKLQECISTRQDTFFLHSNNLQVLAFNESAVLRTFLAAYQIQPDSIWLNRALNHIRIILETPKRKSDINQTSAKVNPPPEFLEASFIIPILRFYLQLIKSPPADPNNLQQLAGFIKIIEQKFLANWKTESFNWEVWPHHQYAALGTVFCLMYRLTQQPSPPLNHPQWQDWYFSMSLEMATFLKQHLKVDTETAAYYWYFDTAETRIENINQGSTTVEFILAAKENGIVFGDADLFRLLNTLRFKIWNQDETKPEFRYCVDGSYSPDSGFQLQTWVFFGLLDYGLQRALQKNLSTWLTAHPLLQGKLRGGVASCTAANLAFVLHKIKSLRSEPIH